jgi:hypothetical protein
MILQVDAIELFGLGERSNAARWVFGVPGYEPTTARPALYPHQKEQIANDIVELSDLCKKIGLTTSLALLNARKNDLPQTGREWDLLVDAVRAELKNNLFLFVPPQHARFYELILPSAVTVAFATASKELVAAGNSLAVGLYTACVFHSMRAAEIGVRSLATNLGVTFSFPIELAEWGKIVGEIEPRIEAIKQQPRSSSRDADLEFYSSAASQFRYFNDGWRVRVSHARATYDETPALRVFNHTIEFFDTLATRLRE